MFKISGAYCAVLTPLNNNLSINNNLHLRHCQSLMQKGLDGLTIFGTNGEASSFSINQKMHSIEFLLENRIDASNLIIGSGAATERIMVNLSILFSFFYIRFRTSVKCPVIAAAAAIAGLIR